MYALAAQAPQQRIVQLTHDPSARETKCEPITTIGTIKLHQRSVDTCSENAVSSIGQSGGVWQSAAGTRFSDRGRNTAVSVVKSLRECCLGCSVSLSTVANVAEIPSGFAKNLPIPRVKI